MKRFIYLLLLAASSLYSLAATTSNQVFGEIPSGSVNGTNATFTLAHTPATSNSLILYRNGLRQLLGNDYTLTGNTITFVANNVPTSGDLLVADYETVSTVYLLAPNNLADVQNPAAALTSLGGASLTANNTFTGAQTFSGVAAAVRAVTQNTTISLNDFAILASAASNGITVSLPTGLTSTQTAIFSIKKTDSTLNTVTVSGAGNTIDGYSSIVLYCTGETLKVQWNGTSWKLLSQDGSQWMTNFVPVLSNTGGNSMTFASTSYITSQFITYGAICMYHVDFSVTLGGTPASIFKISLPIPAVGSTEPAWGNTAEEGGNYTQLPSATFLSVANQALEIYNSRGYNSTFITGAGQFLAAASYRTR